MGLRKVLMGIKDPQPSAAAKETPRRPLDTAGRSQDPPATHMFIEAPVKRQPKEAPTVQQPMAVNNNNNNNNPLVSGKPGTSRSQQQEEEAGDKKTSSDVAAAIPKEKESPYAKTSVLKHLLHRFTGANQ